jgi:hypothetical protein
MHDPVMIKRYFKVDLKLTPRMHKMALDIGDGKFFVSNSDLESEWVSKQTSVSLPYNADVH